MYCGSLLGLKLPGREIDHSAPCSAELRSEWSLHAFMMWTGAPLPFNVP
jgi:hypothetical protein